MARPKKCNGGRPPEYLITVARAHSDLCVDLQVGADVFRATLYAGEVRIKGEGPRCAKEAARRYARSRWAAGQSPGSW